MTPPPDIPTSHQECGREGRPQPGLQGTRRGSIWAQGVLRGGGGAREEHTLGCRARDGGAGVGG